MPGNESERREEWMNGPAVMAQSGIERVEQANVSLEGN